MAPESFWLPSLCHSFIYLVFNNAWPACYFLRAHGPGVRKKKKDPHLVLVELRENTNSNKNKLRESM